MTNYERFKDLVVNGDRFDLYLFLTEPAAGYCKDMAPKQCCRNCFNCLINWLLKDGDQIGRK